MDEMTGQLLRAGHCRGIDGNQGSAQFVEAADGGAITFSASGERLNVEAAAVADIRVDCGATGDRHDVLFTLRLPEGKSATGKCFSAPHARYIVVDLDGTELRYLRTVPAGRR